MAHTYTVPSIVEVSSVGSYVSSTLRIGGREIAVIRGYERGCMEPDGGTGRWTPAGGHRILSGQDATWQESDRLAQLAERVYSREATARIALERALGLRPAPEPPRHCGMCAAYGVETVTRSSREWLDMSVAGGAWRPLCRACYRELRAAYASGAQGAEIRSSGAIDMPGRGEIGRIISVREDEPDGPCRVEIGQVYVLEGIDGRRYASRAAATISIRRAALREITR